MAGEYASSNFKGSDDATAARLTHSGEEEPMRGGDPTAAAFSPQMYEKPLFHNSQRLPACSVSVPFVLSGNGESIPYTINRYLRDYQREGVRFIHCSYAKSRGCILGDDMGLGKTIQVIAFLAAVLKKKGTWEDVENNVPDFLLSQRSSKQHKTTKIFLIVAPLSVLYNWKEELDTWGHFRVIVVHGARREEEFARIRRGRCEVALTNYETLRLCVEQFNSINWSAVIVDEAHRIKNPSSQITQAMKQMRCKVRVGLTGTVLQNNLEELWCVVDWANPGCLGTLESFRKQFSDPIEHGQRHSVTKRALATGREAARVLARRLSRCFLRRTKALICAQLPRKDDRVVFCSLTDFQQAVYRAVLDSEDVSLLLRNGQQCCGSGRPRSKCCFKNNSKGVPVKYLYFSYLAILRKVANHVALLQPRQGTSKKQEQYVNEICEKVFKKFPEFTLRCKQAAFEAMSDPKYSGKMKVLQRLLNHYILNKDKVLLFSLSTKVLDILESYCMATGLEYRRLDGTTKCMDRLKIVKEFNSSLDINICLVSTMAGGLGLNFVGANVVVLFDPTWNPASDLQAVDRVYRIGQYRDVTVLRLISLGTVEEIVYLRQVYKQQLQSAVVETEHARRYFEAVQGPDGRSGELFGIRNLFRMQIQGTCLTRQILEREGRLEAGILTAQTLAGERAAQSTSEVQPVRNPIPAKGSVGRLGGGTGVLDFSSASEDEDGCGTRRRELVAHEEAEQGTSGSVCLARLNFLHPGFSKHLQGSWLKTRQGSGESSEENSVEEDDEHPSTDPEPRVDPTHDICQNRSISSESEGEQMGRCQMDGDRMTDHVTKDEQGADSHAPAAACGKSRTKRRRVCSHLALEDSEESASSSDGVRCDKRKTKHPRPGAHASKCNTDESDVEIQKQVVEKNTGHAGLQGSMRQAAYTRLKNGDVKEVSVHTGEDSSGGPIDKLLGGVQEVVYTHSNQRVVGSSRVEDHISRAALRDVFQLCRNTQAPANDLLDSPETLSTLGELQPSAPARVEGGGTEEARMGQYKPPPKHPVTQTVKTTHQTKNTTLIFGETPSGARRRQLSEMAAYFHAPSVEAFAEKVLRSTSDARKAMLREFHSHQSPHLKAFMDKIFGEPEVPLPAIPTAPSELPTLSSKTNCTFESCSSQFTSASEVKESHRATRPSPNVHKPEGRSSTKLNANESKPGCTSASHGGSPPQGCPLPAVDGSAMPAPTLVSSHSQDRNPGTRETLLSDLIGDTSILDDLFRRKTRSNGDVSQATACTLHSAERAKSRCKDVWDILSEGNEEHINKLTDLSQTEKICNGAIVAAGTSRGRATNGSQLWKRNEKFLWKK